MFGAGGGVANAVNLRFGPVGIFRGAAVSPFVEFTCASFGCECRVRGAE